MRLRRPAGRRASVSGAPGSVGGVGGRPGLIGRASGQSSRREARGWTGSPLEASPTPARAIAPVAPATSSGLERHVVVLCEGLCSLGRRRGGRADLRPPCTTHDGRECDSGVSHPFLIARA